MKKTKRFAALLLACLCAAGLPGCSSLTSEEEEEEETNYIDYSEIDSICELATLKCYYHNVAKAETEASGLFKIFGVGYKKIWIEYSGIVELGIDASLVSITQPDEENVITVTIPEAEVLSVDLDEDSLGEPLTETGFLTTITTEEETTALSSAQDSMEEAVKENDELLEQAQDRAKELIEAYISNIGELTDTVYTIEWNEIENNADEDEDSEEESEEDTEDDSE